MESLKKLGILAVFGIIIVILLYTATPKTTIVTTTPSQQAYLEPVIIVEPETPTYQPPTIPQQEYVPPPLALVPAHAYLWVNSILVPTIISEYSFIPLKKDKIKTFSGSFGPYSEDMRKYLTVTLCSEDARVPSAPSCQLVDTVFRAGYIEFGTGYKEDEYVGYTARKDYYVYYQVHTNENLIAESPKAYVRTVEE